MENLVGIKSILATLGGLIAVHLGGFDIYIKFLLLIMLVDVITGVLGACFEHGLSSEKLKKGIVTKLLMLLFIVIAVSLDLLVATALNIKLSILIRNVVIFWFIIEEMISILENMTKLGVPIPKALHDILKISSDKAMNSTPKNFIKLIKVMFTKGLSKFAQEAIADIVKEEDTEKEDKPIEAKEAEEKEAVEEKEENNKII